MSTVWYATREDVKAALDSAETARNNAQIDRALSAATPIVEGQLRRKFYPLVATKYFDWPNDQRAFPWRLWFDQHDLASLTTLVTGGITVPSSGYYLEPNRSGPPYTNVVMRLDSQYAFSVGATFQRSIAITGVWSYNLDEDPAGTLAAAVLDTTGTTINVTDSASIGVGQILRIDNERMTVTGKSQLTTGQTVQTPMTASNANDQLAVSDGTKFVIGEVLTVDTERMLVVDIAGNNLTVKRAWDGSVLASHSGSTIYAPRTLTVVRGDLGTTAATHSNTTAIAKHRVPGLVRQLQVAESLVQLGLETTGYLRTATRGEGQGRPVISMVEDLRQQAYQAHGRKIRNRAA